MSASHTKIRSRDSQDQVSFGQQFSALKIIVANEQDPERLRDITIEMGFLLEALEHRVAELGLGGRCFVRLSA